MTIDARAPVRALSLCVALLNAAASHRHWDIGAHRCKDEGTLPSSHPPQPLFSPFIKYGRSLSILKNPSSGWSLSISNYFYDYRPRFIDVLLPWNRGGGSAKVMLSPVYHVALSHRVLICWSVLCFTWDVSISTRTDCSPCRIHPFIQNTMDLSRTCECTNPRPAWNSHYYKLTFRTFSDIQGTIIADIQAKCSRFLDSEYCCYYFLRDFVLRLFKPMRRFGYGKKSVFFF